MWFLSFIRSTFLSSKNVLFLLIASFVITSCGGSAGNGALIDVDDDPLPIATETPLVIATPTQEPTSEASPDPTATPQVTNTPVATAEPTATPASTPNATATPETTPEATPTPTATPETTPEATATPTPEPTPTTTPIETDTNFEYRNAGNIVFSGHSLTDASVPTVARIASEKSIDLNYLYQTVPGSTIRYRTAGSIAPDNNTDWSGFSLGTPGSINVANELRNPTQLPNNETYDSLVITERHDILGTVEWENTASLLRQYHTLLRAGNPNARTYLYNSWLGVNSSTYRSTLISRHGEPAWESPTNWTDIPSSDLETWINYEKNALITWECISSKLNLVLEDSDLPTNVSTIAAGWALAHMVEAALANEIPGISGATHEKLSVIFSDNVHLTSTGDLFVGAFTFGEIFGQTAEGTNIPSDVNTATGEYLLELAWSLVQQYHNRENNGIHTMESCREHISTNTCPPFWSYFSGRDDLVPNCQSYFGNASGSNPFKWPDANMVTWPLP